MKLLPLVLFSLLTFSSFAQNYSFPKDFTNGTVFFKDGTQKTGQVKWTGEQEIKLEFRVPENGIERFAVEEITAFLLGSRKFVPLLKFKAYADDYAVLGIATKIKRTFGEQIDSGKFNIYVMCVLAYNRTTGVYRSYPNYVFQNTRDNSTGLAAYPFALRMTDKKYEKAKQTLYPLFKDYPGIAEAIRNYKQEDDFKTIVDMVKAVNRQ